MPSPQVVGSSQASAATRPQPGWSRPRRQRSPGHPQRTPRAAARADTHDRARDDVRRRHRACRSGQGEHDRGRRRLGRETVDRLELDDAVAHRLHDPPPTDRSAQREGRRGNDDHPPRDRRRRDQPSREQRQGDDAHRLLGVVRTVGEGHEPGRNDLKAPKDCRHRPTRRLRKIQKSSMISRRRR